MAGRAETQVAVQVPEARWGARQEGHPMPEVPMANGRKAAGVVQVRRVPGC